MTGRKKQLNAVGCVKLPAPLAKNEAPRSPPEADGVSKRNCAVAYPPSLYRVSERFLSPFIPAVRLRGQGIQAKAKKRQVDP